MAAWAASLWRVLASIGSLTISLERVFRKEPRSPSRTATAFISPGMQGLALLVQEGLGRDPFAGDVFVFRGRAGSLIKALWHGLVEARVIDLDGVYNPCRPNDRLLLGMKGSISEFELGVLRARMLDAARAKARRGELRISVPIGYIWHREIGLGFDPDLRIQEVVRLIFQ